MLIDVAIWGDRNVIKKEAEKILKYKDCGYRDWIGLAQDRDGWRKLVNAVMNLRVP